MGSGNEVESFVGFRMERGAMLRVVRAAVLVSGLESRVAVTVQLFARFC